MTVHAANGLAGRSTAVQGAGRIGGVIIEALGADLQLVLTQARRPAGRRCAGATASMLAAINSRAARSALRAGTENAAAIAGFGVAAQRIPARGCRAAPWRPCATGSRLR